MLHGRDDGPGIPPDRIATVLQRGVRGDERVQGHGIGLAIVRDIVRVIAARSRSAFVLNWRRETSPRVPAGPFRSSLSPGREVEAVSSTPPAGAIPLRGGQNSAPIEPLQVRRHLRHRAAQRARVAEVVFAAHREELLRRFGGVVVDGGAAAGVDAFAQCVVGALEIALPIAAASRARQRRVPSIAPSSASSLCAISCTATQNRRWASRGRLRHRPRTAPAGRVPEAFADQFVLPFVQHAGGVDVAALGGTRPVHQQLRPAVQAFGAEFQQWQAAQRGQQQAVAVVELQPGRQGVIALRRRNSGESAQARLAFGRERLDPRARARADCQSGSGISTGARRNGSSSRRNSNPVSGTCRQEAVPARHARHAAGIVAAATAGGVGRGRRRAGLCTALARSGLAVAGAGLAR